ncbi:hypothetical protein BANT918_02935 [Brevibacterium antiquum CNRZ 918]|uniref:DUF559 domain-containing protein n=2 Tax=Brevibacteriaceae TaxID=85019 RepID=A0A2H1KW73_9MICO|nr:hypothetical protein BANT918_02935 [Brevibacterium antiquum CNRZ 918]
MTSMFNDHRWELRDYPLLFEARKASERGITRHSLLHTPRYPVVVPGIRMDRETFVRFRTPIWADHSWQRDALRFRAALMKHPSIVAGHALAARLYGWPLPTNLMTDQLHVCTAEPNARIIQRLITLHRSKNFSQRMWFDLPILDAVDVFIGVGPDLLLRDLVKLGDAAIGNWHGRPQADLNELQTQVIERSFLRRRAHLLAAIDLMRPTVDSPAETDLRLWAIAVGLPEPVAHPQIHCPSLNWIVEPDLGYPDKKLALEYEGDHHRASKRQWTNDIERDEALRNEDWTVLKVTSRTNYRQLEAKIRLHLGL